jgi:hypothetical protein
VGEGGLYLAGFGGGLLGGRLGNGKFRGSAIQIGAGASKDLLELGTLGAGFFELKIQFGEGLVLLGEVEHGLAALGLYHLKLMGQFIDGSFGLLEAGGRVVEAGLVLAGALLGGSPLATGEVQLGLEGLTALALFVQLGGEPVALGPEGADALVALDEGDGLLGRLMFVLPEAFLGDPEAAIGGSLGTPAGGRQLLVFLKGLDRHGEW